MDGKSVWRSVAALVVCVCLRFGALQAQTFVSPPDQPGSPGAYAALPAPTDLAAGELTMEQRLQMLEGEVASLREAAAPATPATPAVKYPVVKLTGFFQADAGWFNQDVASYETLGDIQDVRGFRRARLAAVGNVAPDTGYSVEMDFAFPGRPSFMDVWLEQRDVPLLQNVRVGQFRHFFGMTELTSIRELTFLERPLPFLFSPFRQIGLGAHGDYWEGAGTWGVSGFGYPTDTFGDVQGDRGYGLSSRVTAVAWQSADQTALIHVGGDYALYVPTDDTLRFRNTPEFGGPFGGTLGNASDVPFFVDTGLFASDDSHVLNAEFAALWGSLHVMSEARYAIVSPNGGDAVVLPSAYIQAGYYLTGERRPYDRQGGVFGNVIPLAPVGRGGGPGAWEVAARYSYVDLNPGRLSGGRLNDVTLGLNWHLNQFTKFQLNYIRAMLDDAAQGESDTNIVAVRAHLDF